MIPDSGDAPGPLSPNDDNDTEFISTVNSLLKDYTDAMDAVKLRLGLQIVMLISMRGNNYLQSSGLNKSLMTSDPTRCAQVVSRAINLIYVLSVLVYPFMPATSESIIKQLNAPHRAVPDTLSIDILAGHTIGTPEHLFKKIEESMGEKWKIQFGGSESQSEAPAEATKSASKKKVAAAKKVADAPKVPGGPKSPEILALEEKIAAQGQVVRLLKGQNPKTPELESQIKAEVDVLKTLKTEFDALLGSTRENA